MENTTENAVRQVTILAASNNADCLDKLGLYTIMLAKRTGMAACLLVVLNTEQGGRIDKRRKSEIQAETQKIQQAGAAELVRIDSLTVTGCFVEEVARFIRIFDTPILIVSEGDCRIMRTRELRMVQKLLQSNKAVQGGDSRHFLVIGKKNGSAQPSWDTPFTEWMATHQKTKEK